jgi:hypothetical protein
MCNFNLHNENMEEIEMLLADRFQLSKELAVVKLALQDAQDYDERWKIRQQLNELMRRLIALQKQIVTVIAVSIAQDNAQQPVVESSEVSVLGTFERPLAKIFRGLKPVAGAQLNLNNSMAIQSFRQQQKLVLWQHLLEKDQDNFNIAALIV